MLEKLLNKIHLPRWLEITLGVVFLLRIPTFFEPYYYGDEMIYLTLGNAIRRGVTLYSQIHDNKPPLLYLLAAIAGNLFWFKVLLAIASIAAIILFFKLASQIFEKQKKVIIATIAFAILTTLPLLEGQIANAENFMLVFSVGALLVLFSKAGTPKNLFLAGLLFGIATLFKVPAAFELPVIAVYWLIMNGKEGMIKTLKKTVILFLGFLSPILLTFIWFYLRGALPDYFRAAFLQNIGYLSSFRPGDVAKPFLVRNGPLLIRGLIVLVGVVVLWLKQKKLTPEFILACLWLLFTLFAATLSERPYPHYLLQAVPPLALLIAILVKGEKIDQVLTVIPIGILLFVPFFFKFYNYSTTGYYSRFIRFATGQLTKEKYMNSFDKNVVNNYKLSDFIAKSTNPDDKIFVWGDSPVIYALTRRLPAIKYTAAYHVIDFSTRDAIVTELKTARPKFVVLLADAPPFYEIQSLLSDKYILLSSTGEAAIWRALQK